jgi:carboxypeptidase C (cathepsin A)
MYCFADNKLFITGESYGGHYVPSTSAYIIAQNAAGVQPQINFSGFLVGNAWTDSFYDNTGAVLMWYWHNMIANETKNGILATCNMSDVGPLMRDSSSIRAQATETHYGTAAT